APGGSRSPYPTLFRSGRKPSQRRGRASGGSGRGGRARRPHQERFEGAGPAPESHPSDLSWTVSAHPSDLSWTVSARPSDLSWTRSEEHTSELQSRFEL